MMIQSSIIAGHAMQTIVKILWPRIIIFYTNLWHGSNYM